MEAIQCTENDASAVVEDVMKPGSSRILKRSIVELAADRQLNEGPRSPARKEGKYCHESYLRQELEQWKKLMTENGIRQSVVYRELEDQNLTDILKDEQKNFIAEAIDVTKMTEASREFRRKFDFFVRVNKLVINLANEKSL